MMNRIFSRFHPETGNLKSPNNPVNPVYIEYENRIHSFYIIFQLVIRFVGNVETFHLTLA